MYQAVQCNRYVLDIWAVSEINNKCAGAQVLGHTKTLLVLTISWLQHKENPNIVLWRQQLGAVLAVAGMLAYSDAEQQHKQALLSAVVEKQRRPSPERSVAGTVLAVEAAALQSTASGDDNAAETGFTVRIQQAP